GHRVSHRLVAELLHELGYSLQGNAKTLEGSSHPDRNAQFEHIHRKVRRFLRQGQPVISVDTKKKELVGDFKTGAESFGSRETRSRCGYMTSSFPSWDGSLRMASTTWARIEDGLAWVLTTTRPPSPWRASGDGGVRWANPSIAKPSAC